MDIVKTKSNISAVLSLRFVIAIILIACVALWLRYFHINGSVWMLQGYDESRDTLVARHIVEYGDWIWRGPLASGSMNQLMNSPFYYYFMAILWFIGRSSLGVLLLWCLVLASVVYIAYRVGVEIWDRQLGLILAGLFAIQPTLISNSRHISQPYLLPLFSSAFLLLFWKKTPMTLWKFCLLIGILMIPMHFHYGSLLMLPAGLLWLGSVWYKQLTQKNSGLSWQVIPVLTVEYFLVTWTWFTYGRTMFDQQFFLYDEVRYNWIRVFARAQVAWVAMADNLWWSKDPNIVLGVLIFFIGVAVWYVARRKSAGFAMGQYWWMLLFAVVPPIIAGFHGDIIHPFYLLSTLPILIIIIGIGLRSLMALNRYVGVVCMFVIVWIFLEQALTVVGEVPRKSYFEQLRDVSKTIHQDYRALDSATPEVPQIALAILAGKYLPYDGWGNGSLWYFLEDYFGRRLINLDDYGTNFVPVVKAPVYFYVVCDNRGFDKEQEDMCVTRFLGARNYISGKPVKVYESEPFVVWRFAINPLIQVKDYNIAYPGL